MRLFVAAEPSDAVRHAAVEAADRLRGSLASKGVSQGIRWIPLENLHLTVWFLGEVSEQRAAAVLEALSVPLGRAPFTLHISGFGAFPPSGPPRVLWMGVTEGLADLSELHDQVGARLLPWGFRPEGRAYSAHLTIARMKEPPPSRARATIRQVIRDLPADAGRCRIEALTVFRSRTAPAGAVYEPLLRVPLA